MTTSAIPPSGERRKALVMGASGFVGSHVTRQLVARGDDVRVLLRKTSPTKGIDDLPVERHYGDLSDARAVRDAMADRDVVFYCVVDARAWLRDPTPLFETNVKALQRVLDIAVDADLDRFVFLSTIGTIAVGAHGEPVTEDTPFNWAGKGGPYIEARREAEDMVLRYARERGLPAVAMCVSTPYGPLDWQPTPHGGLVATAALGKVPFYVDGAAAEVVGVEDAALALVLAAEKGRVGERYIISESYQPLRDVLGAAAEAGGARRPWIGIPMPVVYGVGALTSIAGWLLRRDFRLTLTAIRLLDLTSPADHGKATEELDWHPKPAVEAIRRAAQFHAERAQQAT